MILICYDGSADAKSAITEAGKLMPGQPATVLSVWTPLSEIIMRMSPGFGLVPSFPDSPEIDEASAKQAQERAEEGAALARESSLDATPRICAVRTTIAAAILAEAGSVGADAILMGSRGLTGVKSLLLGSVSHGVLQHADRAVIVVPSAEVAERRTRQLHEH